ncbi:dihydrofolate reductase family protein [Mucilaginibacter sp. CSA2-8R]|uniref:dihydrofolate reductase family protein n=1 Tax=Mucilaginibacter sp. CSA2-8R TaxID=3141542 RepID=UPI00315CCA4B
MRKLKLQMQITVDGFVAGPEGELDWMWTGGQHDDAMFNQILDIADSCDIILLGGNMTPGFIAHWENVVDHQPDSVEQPLAQRMVNMKKIVFSRNQSGITGRNLQTESGDLATAIHQLKAQPGKDLLVYGGAQFVNSLINLNLIDEYYLFTNPIAIGEGMRIFNSRKPLRLNGSIAYQNGKILNKYVAVPPQNSNE